MIELLNELEEKNVSLFLDQEELKLSYQGDTPDAGLLDKIRSNKIEIISFLKKYSNTQSYKEIPLTDQRECYPLSSSQYRIWLSCSSDEISVTYNVPNYFTLKGDYDVAALIKAIDAAVDRHETLRTIFKEDKQGNIKQWILSREKAGFQVNYYDFKNNPDKEKILQNVIKEDVVTPFLLDKECLLRASIFQTKEDCFVLYFNIHHIISDTWSLEVLVNDILAFYKAHKGNTEPNLPPLRIQYKDYTVWKEKQEEEQNETQEKYWTNKLSGELPVLDLPSYTSRPPVKTYNGISLETYLSEEITKRFKLYCEENGLSLFMGLLSLWNVLFYKYTGSKDIIIGTAVAGRDHLDLKYLVGCFINTIVLRNVINPEDDFISFCQKTKEETLTAYDHQTYPFDQLVNKLQLKRDHSRGILFDVMFLFQNAIDNNANDFHLEENVADEIKLNGEKGTVSDLDITFREEGRHLKLDVVFNSDIYDQSVIENLMKHFNQLLLSVLQNPFQKINKIDYLTQKEKNQVLYEFNQTETDCPKDKTIVDLFEDQVVKYPDNIAVVFEDKKLTYTELNEKANQLGSYLKDKYNVNPDNLIGIKLDKSEMMIVAILGVLKSGGAYVPIDSDYPQERIDFIKKDSNSKLIIDDAVLELFQASQEQYSKSNIQQNVSPDNLAYVIYTSGTTGKPKGVMVEHKNVVNLIDSQTKQFGINQSEKILQSSNYSFDASVEQIFLALLNGAGLYLIPKEKLMDELELEAFIYQNKITHFHSVPSIVQKVKPDSKFDLKRVISGGETCPKTLADSWTGFCDFYNEYGPTETTVTSIEFRNDPNTSFSIGKPIYNTQVYILDEVLQPLPIGAVGKIYISGYGVTRGYLNQTDLTAEKFINNPFIAGTRMYDTGDLGRFLPNGNIDFFGRKDNQVKIRGFRIELGEIDNDFLSLENISQAFTLINEQEEDKFIVSYVVGNAINLNQLRDQLRLFLPEYMIPKHIIIVDEMPLTSNGKIDKNALLQVNAIIETTEYLAPESALEKLLVETAETVLNTEKLGLLDNFYNVGGDSIKSIQLISKLKQKGYKISAKDILISRNFMELSKVITINEGTISQEKVAGEVPLTPIQHFFFNDSGFKAHHHFNQSVVLKSKKAIDSQMLQQCLEKLVSHHDALRMVYKKGESNWNQYNEDYADFFSVHTYDLTHFPNQSEKIEAIGSELQAGFILESGPLFKAAHFKLSDGDRLALIVHHLVVDGVSWRVILEDLSLLFLQSQQNLPLTLPFKTNSFREWSLSLKEHAGTERILEEEKYWMAVCESEIPQLPKDLPCEETVLENDAAESIVIQSDFIALLQSKKNRFSDKTEINDILLTALGMAVNETFMTPKMLLKLEGHGREDIIEDIDITRTVGWFTTVFPFLLEIPENSNYIDNLMHVKKELSQIPNKGIGYGILKYLSGRSFREIVPSIEFNYLGDFGSSVGNDKESFFEYSSDSIGNSTSDLNGNLQLLSVLGIMSSKELHFSIRYSKKAYLEETIKKLAKSYEIHLKKLISMLSDEESFSEIPNSMEEPVSLANKWKTGDKVEVSKSQKAFIRSKQNHGILNPIQINSFSRKTFENQFRQFLKHADFLSIGFETEDNTVFQTMLDPDKVKLDIRYEDFEELMANSAAVEDIVRDFFHEPYDIFHKESIRLFIITSENQPTYLLTAIHHGITDMYTNAIIENKLQDYFNGKEVSFNACSNFDFSVYQRDFQQTKQALKSRAYWQEKLKNIAYSNGIETEYPDCIVQKATLSGKSLERLKRKAKEMNLPLNAMFLTAYYKILQEMDLDKAVMNIIANCRNEAYDDPGMDQTLGMISNFLPMPILPFSAEEDFKNVYFDYLEMLGHQAIPYEQIWEDLYNDKKIDLEKAAVGIFNYQVLEHFKNQENDVPVISTTFNKNDYTKGVDLTCVVYNDAIELTLVSKLEYYNRFSFISLEFLLNQDFLEQNKTILNN
jgi:amino acid adenylation domain-containing protein/non-ribosomal peptide synthase protein (TIGR01720 family)